MILVLQTKHRSSFSSKKKKLERKESGERSSRLKKRTYEQIRRLYFDSVIETFKLSMYSEN